VYTDTTNVIHEKYDHTGNNCSYRIGKKKLEKQEAMSGVHSIDPQCWSNDTVRTAGCLNGGDRRWYKGSTGEEGL